MQSLIRGYNAPLSQKIWFIILNFVSVAVGQLATSFYQDKMGRGDIILSQRPVGDMRIYIGMTGSHNANH